MSSQPANRSMEKNAKLLFIDDEPRVLASMKAMFRQRYQVATATSGREALALLNQESVDVVISDQRMPGMTGVETLSEIRRDHPQITRILLTGYADLEAVEASINECEVFRYLMKPCPADELSEVIEQALTARRESRPQAAQLIEFPVARRRVQTGQSTKAGRAAPAETTANRQTSRPGKAARSGRTAVLVLSRDRDLLKMIRSTADAGVKSAADLEAALALLQKGDIGVIVIDAETITSGLEATAARLKSAQPSSVLLVASPRGDATLLINLINTGDIHRFLLKPVAAGQCRLWLDSASRRYQQLATPITDTTADAATPTPVAIRWLVDAWRRFTGTGS